MARRTGDVAEENDVIAVQVGDMLPLWRVWLDLGPAIGVIPARNVARGPEHVAL
jgi:hypothetical protein